jgi:hypothetical protein
MSDLPENTSTGKVFTNGRTGPIVNYLNLCRPDLKDKIIPQQRELLRDMTDSKILRQVLSCGRGFSKSMCAGLVGLYFADEYSTKIGKPLTVIVVSSQDALYSNIAEFFRWRPELKKRLVSTPSNLNEIPVKGIQFRDNYSKLIPRMATIHSVEGSRADIIIFDESQDIPEEVFLKGLGCVRDDTVGKILVLGTPYTETKGKGGKPNWFISLVENPKKYIKGFSFHLSQYSSELCDWNPHELWKAAWNKQRYDAECLGKVTPVAERSFFPTANINKCCFDMDATREGGPKSVLETGIDCGFNNTTYCLVEHISPVKAKVLFMREWLKKSIEDIAPEIADLLRQHNPMLAKIDSRQGSNVPSYHKEIKKYWRGNLVAVDASLREKVINEEGQEELLTVKWNMLGQMGRRLREGQLIIPTRLPLSAKLIDQMKKYNPRRGQKDDVLDSVLLACYRPTTPYGSLHSRISGFKVQDNNIKWWKNRSTWRT